MKKLYTPRTNCNHEKVVEKDENLNPKDDIELVRANKGYALFSSKKDFWIRTSKKIDKCKIFDNSLPKKEITGWYLSSPGEIGIELTRNCNQRCIYCWNKSGKGTDITDKLFYDIINQFRKRGGQKVEICGGEPFMHSSLPDYLNFLKEKEVPHIGLATNGTLINKEIVKKISPNIKNIGVSLQASNESLNTLLTTREGFFKKTLQGIENLITENIPVILLHTIMPENESDLNSFFRLAKKMDINYIKFNFLRPIGRAHNKKRYTQHDLDLLKTKVLNLSYEFDIEADISSLISKIPLKEEFEFYGSNSLRYYLKINHDGKCTPAPFSNTFIGDLNYQSLEEVWFGNKANEIRNKMKCPNPKCKLKNRCGGLWQKL